MFLLILYVGAVGVAGSNVPGRLKSTILGAARKYGIRPGDLAGLLDVESNFNSHSSSSAGAVGIAQFLPSTARSMGVNPWNDNSAIYGAAKYLHSLGYSRDRLRALGAYNGGPGNPQYGYAHQVVSRGSQLAGQLGSAPAAQGNRVTASAPGTNTTTTIQTTPGVDNSALRQSLKGQYLSRPLANPFSAGNLKPVGAPDLNNPPAAGPDISATLNKSVSATNALLALRGNLQDAQDVAPTSKTSVVQNTVAQAAKGGAKPGNNLVFRGVQFTPGVVGIGKALQKLGLHVGENPHFGGVAGGEHANYGYYDHYHGGAIDVTGPAWLLNTVANFLAHHKAQLGIPTSGAPNLGGHRGSGVLYQVPDHFDHLHVSASH